MIQKEIFPFESLISIRKFDYNHYFNQISQKMGNQPSICQFKHQSDPDKTLPQKPCGKEVIPFQKTQNSSFKSMYCQDHKCPHDGCKNPIVFGLNSCQKHKCRISTCVNSALCIRLSCELHLCKLSSCPNSKLEDEDVCKECQKLPKCQIEYCYQRKPSRIYTGQPAPDQEYVCHEHICSVPLCSEMIVDRSTFCRMHKCQRTGCSDIVTVENGFCRNHRPTPPKI